MRKRVFLSYNYAEQRLLNDLLPFFARNGGPIDAEPVYVTEDVSKKGKAAIETHIAEAMAGCCGALVLVGEMAHNKPWTAYEIEGARSGGLPVTGLRHPSQRATPGGPPAGFEGLAFVDWNPERIAAHVKGWEAQAGLHFEWVATSPLREVHVERARVPGGWIVLTYTGENTGTTYVPDPEGRWLR